MNKNCYEDFTYNFPMQKSFYPILAINIFIDFVANACQDCPES